MRLTVGCGLLVLAIVARPAVLQPQTPDKFDPVLQPRSALASGQSDVIITADAVTSIDGISLLVQQLGGTVGRRFTLINAVAATLPNSSLSTLAANATVLHIAMDRAIAATMERTSAAVGATVVRQNLGLDGSGIGVAVIDSGITPWHDDLTDPLVIGSQRVDQFVDFAGGASTAYDDYGHGTHVAGIIAGNGFDSGGARSGIAPRARLVVLKVLDGSGRGRISDVIAAFEYAVAHQASWNIRVINMSIGAGVYESYTLDPLTLAAKAATDQGLVVVAAAGNLGRGPSGPRYGGITAPGNAPWVLTVGASSHMGTIDRADDTVAAFSSRGPTAIDRGAKPDLVAPGVGIESLAAPGSLLYSSMGPYLLPGTTVTTDLPYLSLSGTSMAAPVVSGTVALMLQANPRLTPTAVKAILQYTAQPYPGFDALTEGAGFLNARGAVELARYFASPLTVPYPATMNWKKRLVRGARRLSADQLELISTSSTSTTTTTTDTSSLDGFGLPPPICPFSCSIDFQAWTAWGTQCLAPGCNPLAVGAIAQGSIGLYVPPPDPGAWTSSDGGEMVVWGTGDDGEMVVWGTGDGGEMVVWGTGDDGEMVVWGTGDNSEMVVWGTGCSDDPSCDPVVWTGR